jgi:hypothetical protein
MKSEIQSYFDGATIAWLQFLFCIACLAFATLQNWRAYRWRRRYFELRNNPVVVELERQLNADEEKYEEQHPFNAANGQRWCTRFGGFFDAEQECRFCRRHEPFDYDKKKGGSVTENASEKFGVADSLAMDTGTGPRPRPLTEQEIVDRTATREARWNLRITIGLLVLLLIGLAFWGKIWH